MLITFLMRTVLTEASKKSTVDDHSREMLLFHVVSLLLEFLIDFCFE